MAEKTILVCDVCGEQATQTAAIRVEGRSLSKDLCGAHLSELLAGARRARRGRPRGSVNDGAKAKPTATRARKSKAKAKQAAEPQE